MKSLSKKIALLMFILLLCCSCSSFVENTNTTVAPSTEQTESTVPTQAINSDFENLSIGEDKLAAVGLLDYSSSDKNAAITEYTKSKLQETAPLVDCGGDELYIIIPKYQDSIISISKIVYDLEFNVTDKVLMHEKSGSVFLICNQSDLISNVEINITTEDMTSTFSPSISLKDGTIVIPNEIADITKAN